MKLSEFEREMLYRSKLTIIFYAVSEEFIFGFIPLLISLIFHFQFSQIFFTQLVSRLLWSTAHFGNQKNWLLIYPIGLLYAVCWSYFPFFVVALIEHPGANLFVQWRMRKSVQDEMNYKFDKQNII